MGLKKVFWMSEVGVNRESLSTKLRGKVAEVDKNVPLSACPKPEWYVMRVTYQRELVAQRLLEGLGVESFVPTMKVKRRKSGGGVYWREEAKVHNYIFVYATLPEIQTIKTTKITYLRYMMGKGEDGQPAPQFVPQKQMEDFMAVCRSEGVKYLDTDIDLRKGDRVRIVGGPLKGVEGVYTKTSLRHERRVVVRIEGVAAVATIAFPSSEVEKIEKEE